MEWKEGTPNSEKYTRKPFTIEMAGRCQNRERLQRGRPKTLKDSAAFSGDRIPTGASSSSQNGPKEYSKLVNKTSHTGTEPQLGNEGRGSIAKLKSEMKSICVSLGSRWAVLEPTLVLASSSVLAARCSVWQSWRIQNPCAHYNYQ